MSDASSSSAFPHSKDSEMMVLGCMLTNINSLNVGADTLEDSDFYFSEHKLIFACLKEAFKADRPADVHLIAEDLKRQGHLKTIGGASYLSDLAQFAGTSAYIEEYCEIVKNKSLLRRMIAAAKDIEKNAYQNPADVYASLDEAQQKFFTISQTLNANAWVHIKDILIGVKSSTKLPFLKELQERQEKFHTKGPNDPIINGIPTLFTDLDKMINGLERSNLIILAARPAMGKTALALNIAEHICFKLSYPVGIFSLEMTSEQLVHRLICSQAEVESEKIKTGALGGIEYQRIVAAVNTMQKSHMIIDDFPGLKITDIRARARRMKESHHIELLIIDYLQLVSGSGLRRSEENRQNEISEISRMLKNLARELNIPVICLSQLSRKVEERHGHRPMMSDLRESGCLAGDTLIKDLQSGHTFTIQELAEREQQTPISVQAVDENLELGEYKMTKAFYSGKKVVYELKLSSHKSIRASANHPFRTERGWMRLDALQVKDFIAIPSPKQESPSSQTTLLCKQIVIWDEIVSITEIGMQEVYDATVEEVHNFVANDILVHNSIEQDADIVMFLLRREYYDPHDKPGMAELIVAKNRHGGVGSINLTYRKEITQFANYTSLPAAIPQKTSKNDAFAAFNPS